MDSAMNSILVTKGETSGKGNRKDQMEDRFVNVKNLANKMKVIVVANETVLHENVEENSVLSDTVGVFKNIFDNMINAINKIYAPTETKESQMKVNSTKIDEMKNIKNNKTKMEKVSTKIRRKNSLIPVLDRLKESDKDTSRSVIYYEEG